MENVIHRIDFGLERILINGRDALKSTFNEVVALHDAYRPSYVDELYKDILKYSNLDDSCFTVDVGIGTGKATQHFLKTGIKLVGVEMGFELVAFLICSATAFYWFDGGNPDYVSLFGTYSNTIAMNEEDQHRFLNEIRAVIEAHGGFVQVFETIDLQLARK